MTTPALLYSLNNGGPERQEMATRGTRLSEDATAAVNQDRHHKLHNRLIKGSKYTKKRTEIIKLHIMQLLLILNMTKF